MLISPCSLIAYRKLTRKFETTGSVEDGRHSAVKDDAQISNEANVTANKTEYSERNVKANMMSVTQP